jgi:hypothetical protein
VWLEEWSTCACTDTMPRIHLRAHAIHTMVWPMLYIPWIRDKVCTCVVACMCCSSRRRFSTTMSGHGHTCRHPASHHLNSHHLISHHLYSHHLISHHLFNHHLFSHHLFSHHLFSHHLFSHYSVITDSSASSQVESSGGEKRRGCKRRDGERRNRAWSRKTSSI